jgi:hypothetical protein
MIRYRAQIKLDLTRAEWQIYDMPGADEAVVNLNKGLSNAINEAWQMIDEGIDYNEALRHINQCFDNYISDYDDFGLGDSEPCDKKGEIISIVFNRTLIESLTRHHPKNKKTGLNI